MANGWTTGSAAAVGIGLGAALAASVGSIGYFIGLVAALGTFKVGGAIQRRRRG